MDPRERADATLARARARGAYVVTPESAISPMDATSTQQIPRSLVSAIDREDNDPDATMVVPAAAIQGRHHAVPAQGEPPADEGPAITQEAATQALPSPSRPRDPSLSWAPPPPPPAPPEPEQLDGLVPTTKEPPHARSTLSQRLDG
jgi:hypothetical protein